MAAVFGCAVVYRGGRRTSLVSHMTTGERALSAITLMPDAPCTFLFSQLWHVLGGARLISLNFTGMGGPMGVYDGYDTDRCSAGGTNCSALDNEGNYGSGSGSNTSILGMAGPHGETSPQKYARGFGCAMCAPEDGGSSASSAVRRVSSRTHGRSAA